MAGDADSGKVFSENTVAILLMSMGASYIPTHAYDMMSALDGKRTRDSFQHQFRSVVKRVKELKQRVDRGEHFQPVQPAKKRRNTASAPSTPAKKVNIMSKGRITPKSKVTPKIQPTPEDETSPYSRATPTPTPRGKKVIQRQTGGPAFNGGFTSGFTGDFDTGSNTGFRTGFVGNFDDSLDYGLDNGFKGFSHVFSNSGDDGTAFANAVDDMTKQEAEWEDMGSYGI